MAIEGGPYIQAACFCETVLEDKTGALSLIRIIDTVTHTAQGPNPPEDMPVMMYNLTLVVMLKSGDARGRWDLRVVPQLPNGATGESPQFTVHFEGEEKGCNAILKLSFPFEMEGLYWFKVYLDDEKLTAIPIRVKYNRIMTGSKPSQ